MWWYLLSSLFLLIASVLASMRWLLCGGDSSKVKKRNPQFQENIPRENLSPLRFLINSKKALNYSHYIYILIRKNLHHTFLQLFARDGTLLLLNFVHLAAASSRNLTVSVAFCMVVKSSSILSSLSSITFFLNSMLCSSVHGFHPVHFLFLFPFGKLSVCIPVSWHVQGSGPALPTF